MSTQTVSGRSYEFGLPRLRISRELGGYGQKELAAVTGYQPVERPELRERNDETHLSPRWVGDLVQRVMATGWTTHTLRHRFATKAYHGSRDLLAVQGLLGHSKPETTHYVQLPDDALRSAIKFAA